MEAGPKPVTTDRAEAKIGLARAAELLRSGAVARAARAAPRVFKVQPEVVKQKGAPVEGVRWRRDDGGHCQDE